MDGGVLHSMLLMFWRMILIIGIRDERRHCSNSTNQEKDLQYYFHYSNHGNVYVDVYFK
jgi:hypothetical protein